MRKSILLLLLIVCASSIQAELPELLGTIVSDTAVAWFGYKISPIGDQNGDGKSELMVWSYKGGNDYFTGQYPIPTSSDLFFRESQPFVRVIDDVNGDGFPDLAFPGSGDYAGRMYIYYGGPVLDTFRDLRFGLDTLYGDVMAVSGGDINLNGTDELIATDSKRVLLFELGPNTDSIPDMVLTPPNQKWLIDFDQFGLPIIDGDFNGDGKKDLLAHWRPPSRNHVSGALYLYWGGSSFDSIPDMIINRPGGYVSDADGFGDVSCALGDFSGDGYDDFFAANRPSDDDYGFIFFGGPDIDTIPDITILGSANAARSAGDINSDGYSDLIIGYSLPFSGSGKVSIYYGGPDADSIPDIVIRNSDVDGYQVELGTDVAGLGDFNGDGIDDFAFSAINGDSKGIVLIYSGFGPITGITKHESDNLPSEFTLSANYPNPFNPSTTIDFEIPNRTVVTLRVLNVLGIEVRTLVQKSLPAGSYSVDWDGKDRSGETVASGVYFYKISTDGFTQSRKMLLLK